MLLLACRLKAVGKVLVPGEKNSGQQKPTDRGVGVFTVRCVMEFIAEHSIGFYGRSPSLNTTRETETGFFISFVYITCNFAPPKC